MAHAGPFLSGYPVGGDVHSCAFHPHWTAEPDTAQGLGLHLFWVLHGHCDHRNNASAAEISYLVITSLDFIMLKRTRALTYLAFGHVFLATGLIGVVVPLLPTTPFILLASWCYARGSERAHRWLRENKLFGVYLREWEEYHSIPLKAKVTAVTMITLTSGYIVYAMPVVAVKVSMVVVGVCVSAYLLTRPTTKR